MTEVKSQEYEDLATHEGVTGILAGVGGGGPSGVPGTIAPTRGSSTSSGGVLGAGRSAALLSKLGGTCHRDPT